MMLLGILRNGARHGYGVVSALHERSGGEFDLPEGTVYPALHRLEDAGLLRSTWETVGGRRRRIYSLSPSGPAALDEAAQRWARFSCALDSVLGATPDRGLSPA